MAQGGKRLLLGDQVFEYRAGQCLVVTADLPVTGHFFDASPERPSLGMGLMLRPAAIAPLVLQPPPTLVARRRRPAGDGHRPGRRRPARRRWPGCCACSTDPATPACSPR